jgi:uncharacterized protein (DUF1800 family)
MLRRIGFGTSGAEVDSVVSVGDISKSVAELLDHPFGNDPGVESTPLPDVDSTLPPAGTVDREQFRTKLRQQSRELTTWWLRRMVAVEQPALEKLTFLWHGHFATSAGPVRSAELMAKQNFAIRSHCLGDFKTLAYSMLTDGAMLRWLNGNSNRAASPNENLAREFMELFALGHGSGYSEVDVREGARALTGWIVTSEGSVRFVPDRHDADIKTVLGLESKHDTASFCNLVVDHPKSAPFVARRLWTMLASDSPPGPSTLKKLINAYGPERDLKSLTLAVLSDADFLRGRATIVNSPVDWYVGLLRTLRVSLEDADVAWDVAKKLRALGQLPFYPPNVGGWPRGQAWLSTGTASLRLQAAKMATDMGDLSAVTDAPTKERVESVGYLLGIGKWSESSAKTLSDYRRDPPALVVAAANTPEYLTT